jgi:hypothetical protein
MTIIERQPKRGASKAGDRIRQGRAGDGVRLDAAGRILIQFELRSDGCHYVRLARADVGVICTHSEGRRPGFTWLCYLPDQRRTPQFAETLDKAKDAMRVSVEDWCQTAGLVSRPKRAGRPVEGWRA